MHRYTAGRHEDIHARIHVLLVVEDEEALGSLASLQPGDYLRISIARNGLSGVEKFCRAIVRDEAFDLVVAQYDMTVLNGQDVLRRIRWIAPETRTALLVRAGSHSGLIERLTWADFVVTGPAQISELLQGSRR